MLIRKRSDHGFTLMEVLAALMVFTIVTLGVIPLLAASLRGSNLARTSNVAKNLGVRAMERVRGLPYHRGLVTDGTTIVPVDVLDFYHPGEAQPTVTVCDSTTGGRPACPQNIPDGFKITFRATFVKGDGVTPLSPAAYDYDATDATKEEPPSSLLHMKITVGWKAVTGQNRSFELDGLVGDRAFGGLDVRGVAHIEYGVQVLTSLEDAATDQVYALSAFAGSSRSDVQVRVDETADQTVEAATMTLTDELGAVRDKAVGAVADLHAPPSQPVVPDVNDTTPDTVALPNGLEVGGVEGSLADDLRVAASGDTPAAEGAFSLLTTGEVSRFWVDNPAARRGPRGIDLRLIPTAKLLSLAVMDGSSVEGSASAVTGASGVAGVESTATVSVSSLRLFPTQFILDQVDPDNQLGTADDRPGAEYRGAVVAVDDFTATVACEGSGVGAVSNPTITWSATLRYWSDPRDGLTNGAYVSVPLSATAASDPLRGIPNLATVLAYEQPASNVPDVDEAGDIYLFDDPDADRNGYLRSWAASVGAANNASITDDKRASEADVDGAIRIDTADVPAVDEEFPFRITMGSLNCEAVDFR